MSNWHCLVLIKNKGDFQINKGAILSIDNTYRNKCFLGLKYVYSFITVGIFK